ncbi:MAG: energy transducer TonB [Pyrinomonadaceae bacterium]|nr:energy transducer TonB [Pyrinomonadaceae bacterium]
MLDQLVESKSNSKENTRRSEFLLGTFVLMVSLLVGSWVYSLFAKDYAMGGSDLELSTLVAPVPVPEEEPPPPPEKQPEQNQKVEPNVVIRKELILDINSTPKAPDKIQTTQMTQKTMPPGLKVKQGNSDFDPKNAIRSDDTRTQVNADESGIGGRPAGAGEGGGTGAPPPPPPPPAAKPSPSATKPPPPKTISGGVVNGKATSLPKPPYPAAARAVRAAGSVSVQVLIDETGRVVSASAASGHPLLQQAAVAAARQARFSPTVLSGQPVKVSGIITYNFVP